MFLMVVSARKENQGILIHCPHCHLGVRFDVSFVEDAINHGDKVKCSACDKEFSIVTKKARQKRNLTPHAADVAEREQDLEAVKQLAGSRPNWPD